MFSLKHTRHKTATLIPYQAVLRVMQPYPLIFCTWHQHQEEKTRHRGRDPGGLGLRCRAALGAQDWNSNGL